MLALPQLTFMALLSPVPDYVQDVNETTAPGISPPVPELTIHHENLRIVHQTLPQTGKFPMAQLLVPPLFAFSGHRKNEDERIKNAVANLLQPGATTDQLEKLAEELLSDSVANQVEIKKLSLFLTHTLAEQFKSAHKLWSEIEAHKKVDNYSIFLPSYEEIDLHVEKPLLALTLLYRCLSVLDDKTKTDILVELDRVCNKKDENWDRNLGILDVILELTPYNQASDIFFDPDDFGREDRFMRGRFSSYRKAHEHDDYELQIKQCFALRIDCMAQMHQISEIKRLSEHLINFGLRRDLHQMARSQKISPECREYFFERFLCKTLDIAHNNLEKARKKAHKKSWRSIKELLEAPFSHMSLEQQQDLTLGMKFFGQLEETERRKWAEILFDVLFGDLYLTKLNRGMLNAVFCSKAFYDALSPESQKSFLNDAIRFDINTVHPIGYQRGSSSHRERAHWRQLDEVSYHWSEVFLPRGLEYCPEKTKIEIIKGLIRNVSTMLSFYVMPNDQREMEELLEEFTKKHERGALGFLILRLYDDKRGGVGFGHHVLGIAYFKIASSLSPAGLEEIRDFANNIPKYLEDQKFMDKEEIESKYYGSVAELYIEIFMRQLRLFKVDE